MYEKIARSGHTKCAIRIGRSAAGRASDRLRVETLLRENAPRPLFRLAIALP
jgi:hypothetical protein